MQEWASFTLDPEVKFDCLVNMRKPYLPVITAISSHVYFLCHSLFLS